MPWANLDDGMPHHPNVIGLTHGAFRLHISGICYCAENTTDGIIRTEIVPLLMPKYRSAYLAELMGRATWLPHPDGYEIRDYLQWNRAKAQIDAERERKSQAGKKGADKRWH